jgi:hypothetical protein
MSYEFEVSDGLGWGYGEGEDDGYGDGSGDGGKILEYYEDMKDFNISLMILVSGFSAGTIKLNAHLKSQEESEKLEEGD